ncbi:hypothetical protein BJ944DRAFT_271179 [Cunninghamella echinulata]|nr:hypothetical protein BJ944DRAFT_271179 [Cunninghamella echinulata]
MPFRCKCGRTYEKPDTFSSHTSSCAPFHQRRPSLSNNVTYESLTASKQASPSLSSSSLAYCNNNTTIIPSTSMSTSSIPPSSPSRRTSLKISTTPSSLDMSFIRRRFSINNKEQTSATSPEKPLFDYPIFMPTALSIQNTFEGVRRRSMSYGAASLNQ